MIDYSVLDSFCKIPTWNSGHTLDKRRFMRALDEIVRDPSFSAEAAGEYIRENNSTPVWGEDDGELDRTIRRLVADAHAVRDYVTRNE